MRLGSKHVTFCAFWKKAKKSKNKLKMSVSVSMLVIFPQITQEKKPKNDGFLIISIVLENLSYIFFVSYKQNVF